MRFTFKETFWIGLLLLVLGIKLVMMIWSAIVNPEIQTTKVDNTANSNTVYSYRRSGHASNNIAVCITGQLARLEIVSKIRNIIVPTLLAGDKVHIFFYLDSDVDDVGQTLWNYSYSSNPYRTFSSSQIKEYVEREIERQYLHLRQFSPAFINLTLSPQQAVVHVRLESIARVVFHVLDNKIPVDNKTVRYSGWCILTFEHASMIDYEQQMAHLLQNFHRIKRSHDFK